MLPTIPLLMVAGTLATIGLLTLCGVYQDGVNRRKLKLAGKDPGPNLAKLLTASVAAFLAGNLRRKPKKPIEAPKAIEGA